ncbi:uncharacterized protein [Gossypium hirsutum]|uniref:Tf2-1-like SH3-like domain-containing protein n=1 Tax=Gossypium hirsutum TaxID=3635 RepID=A0ABM2YVH3_GOSHI|nr:uncharacterized protein LOC121208028 [Gossypium hirsutum]
MAPYGALYGCKCRTPLCWTELGERQVLGLELVSKTEDKVRLIQDHLKAVSDKQKSYADLKMRDIKCYVRDFIFLKRVGPVAYQLKLLLELNYIHDVFHVSILRRYRSDLSYVVSVKEIEVRPNLTFEDKSIQILGCDVKVLRGESILLVKVQWRNHGIEEATWRPEDSIRQ